MSSWTDLFDKKKGSYVIVEISESEEKMLSKAAHRMESKQETEIVYSFDNYGISTRWLVGLLGEYAVSKKLKEWGLIEKMPSFDLEEGLSSTYDTADLMKVGLNLGCKTVGIGKAALVKENETYPEVISVYDKYRKLVYICGIATPDVLKKYSDLDLVEDYRVRSKAGSVAGKVGFNRFDKLIPFSRENVERFRSDLEVEYSYYLSKEEREKLLGKTSYIEVEDEELHIRSWNENNGILDETFNYPLTKEDMKRMVKVLEPNRVYIGFRLTPIIERIQSDWIGESLKIRVIDMASVLSIRNKKYKEICNQYKTSEAITAFNTIFKPQPPFRVDSINANYYMFLDVLCK